MRRPIDFALLILDPFGDLEAMLISQEWFLRRHLVGDDLFFDLIPKLMLAGEIGLQVIEANIALLRVVVVASITVFFQKRHDTQESDHIVL